MPPRERSMDVDDEEEEKVMDEDIGKPDQQAAAGPAAVAAPAPVSSTPALPERPKGGLQALPPRGLGAGLVLPAKKAAELEPQQPQQQQPAAFTVIPADAAAPSATPKLPPRPAGLGAGLGAAGMLPSRSAAPAPASQPAASPPAAAVSAAPAAAGTAPAAPAGLGRAGLRPALPPRPAAAAAAPSPAAAAPSPAAAAAPAGLSALPPRPVAAAAAAPPRPAAAPPRPAAAPSAPSAVQGSGLPPRPAAVAPPAGLQVAAAAAAAASGTDVVDPSEDKRVQRVQRTAHDIRVRLIRAATRLGLSARSDQVAQFLQAIERSERMVGAQHYTGSRRVDLIAAAERDARAVDQQEPPLGPIAGLRVKILVLGMTGTGKTELINSLLGRTAGARTNPFRPATRGVRVVRGAHNGIPLTFIDTPGLHAAASRTADNKATLRAVRAAYTWHKPDYVFYVDRLDATRPGFGEMGLLSLITEALGQPVWRNTMAVLTHAHAARTAFGPQYDVNSRQRRNIMSQLLRQAAGDQQSRNPVFLADCHPSCPTNSLGQPVILEGPTAVPWKQQLLVQLVGYKSYNMATAAFKELAKIKAGKAAAAAGGAKAPQDMFKQLMRSRLPPMTFFVEQMTEGVLKPEGWATMETVAGLGDEVTEDEEAESFQHAYNCQMYDLALSGDPWAQREYATMLRAYDRSRETYKASYQEADLDTAVELGIESYVVDPIDFGPSFDPEDMYSYRHAYAEATDAGVSIIPSQDYYGPEHDDPLNGIVFQYESQPFSRDGWGGVPFDLTVCCEKDKTSLCLQGESHVSIVHSVPPFGPRHITQVTGSWEVLRPNIKDVMYQLEVDTFKDGLLGRTDHAGCGMMVARLGEGGDPRKGPTAVGVRLQDTFRAGPFKVEACASKVAVQGPTGGKEEGWGARAFVHYDWLPGVGMAFDFIQERTPEEAGKRLRGYGANFTYDWEVLGAAFGMEVDYVAASESVFVSVNAFSGNDYRLGWLLLLPAVNYAKESLSSVWGRLRGGGGGGAEEEEGEEGDEAAMMMAQEGDL